MSGKAVTLLIFFSTIILLSGTVLANNYPSSSSLHEINETNNWSKRVIYNVPYSEWQDSPDKIIFLLSKLNEESLTNCTNPKSPIYDPNILKAYGNIPRIENTSQLAEFSSTLQTVRDSSIHEVKPYFYPEGPIVDYGAGHMPGYFLIKLYDYEGNKTVYSEAELEGMYNIVEKYAVNAGIDKVPVIFSLWNKTAIFYFSGNNSTLRGDFIQLTDIEPPVFYYNIANSSSLQNIKNGSSDEIKPYLYPKGPIIEYGSDEMEGVFPIKLCYDGNETVYSQTELDEISDVVNKYANTAGLDGVSVVFYNQEGIVHFDGYNNKAAFSSKSISEDRGFAEINDSNNINSKSLNEDSSKIKNTGENKSGKSNSAPGFGLLGSLTCLYGGWKLRRK